MCRCVFVYMCVCVCVRELEAGTHPREGDEADSEMLRFKLCLQPRHHLPREARNKSIMSSPLYQK